MDGAKTAILGLFLRGAVTPAALGTETCAGVQMPPPFRKVLSNVSHSGNCRAAGIVDWRIVCRSSACSYEPCDVRCGSPKIPRAAGHAVSNQLPFRSRGRHADVADAVDRHCYRNPCNQDRRLRCSLAVSVKTPEQCP